MKEELKPCPFCGGKARKTPNKGYISCENVNCLGEAFDEERWNIRYEPIIPIDGEVSPYDQEID